MPESGLFFHSSLSQRVADLLLLHPKCDTPAIEFSCHLSYRLKTLCGNGHITCYLQGNDLFTIKATDEDPEYAYGGFRLQPTYTIGVKFAY